MYQTNNPTALQSQKWILQSLLDLMQSASYDRISVAEICRKAELDRRTFYRNFESKDDVLEQYIQKLSFDYMEEYRKIETLNKKNATLAFFRFWEKHLHFIRDMQKCGLGDFIFKRFQEFTISNRELLIHKEKMNVPTQYIFAYRIGGFWNVMLTWAANHADVSAEELAEILSQA